MAAVNCSPQLRFSFWNGLAFHLSSFINSIRWHKDIQSSWRDCVSNSPMLVCSLKVEMHKHVAVTDYCTSADPSCLLLADKQGEVICDGLAHSERESWLKLSYIRHGPRACTGTASQTRWCTTTCSPTAVCVALLWLSQKFFWTLMSLWKKKGTIIDTYSL